MFHYVSKCIYVCIHHICMYVHSMYILSFYITAWDDVRAKTVPRNDRSRVSIPPKVQGIIFPHLKGLFFRGANLICTLTTNDIHFTDDQFRSTTKKGNMISSCQNLPMVSEPMWIRARLANEKGSCLIEIGQHRCQIMVADGRLENGCTP